MRLGWAVFITLSLFTLSVLVVQHTGANIGFLIVLGSAAWAAVDSAAIGLQRYRTRLALRPAAVFLWIALIWIVAFPWYLLLRQKLLAGELELRQAAEGEEKGDGDRTPPAG